MFIKIIQTILSKMNLHSLIEKIAKELSLHNSKMQTFCWMILGMINQQDVQHGRLILNFKSSGTLKSSKDRTFIPNVTQNVDF